MSVASRGYPLSPIQQGMLIHHLRSPQSGADIEQMVVSIHEAVDPEALRTAWNQLTAANDVLRTAFEWEGFDQPLQRIEADVSLPWNEVDCEHLSEGDWVRFVDAFLDEDRRKGFDMRVAPLARCALFRRRKAEWTFVWTFHHILADGQSYPQLVREGFGRYDALRGGREVSTAVAPAYRTFIAWQQDHLAAQSAVAEAFWRSNVENVTPCPLPFHLAPPTSDSPEPEMHELSRTMPAGITSRLRAIGAAANFGISTVLEAAWAWLLHSSSGAHDVLVGITRAGRRNTVPEADRIVGSFISTVPARVRIDPHVRVVDWLRDLREQSVLMREFEHTRLVDILKWSGVSAGMPLFDSLIVYTPRLLGAALREEGGSWATRDVSFREQTSFPVTIFGYGERDLLVKIAYDRRRITAATVERWLDQFTAVLTAMAENVEGRVGDLPLAGSTEVQALSAWNATARGYEEDDCIHELFERQARKTPQATALVFRDRRLTYAELDMQASALARHLQTLGAGPGTVAGIYVERSLDMVVGLLGILKAGAAYLPLDPSYPREPLALMVEDAGVEIVVTQRHLAESVPGTVRHRVILEDATEAVIPPPVAPRARTASPDDLAYLIFTSGSTGRPKGVMVRHRNVTNFFAGMDDRLDASRAGTWLAVTSISFDISVLELFWTLSRGFTVIVQDTLDRAGLSGGPRTRSIDFSLFYFSAAAEGSGRDKYRLLLEGARYADKHGFTAVWTPERHFHEFGGLYPNPSVTSAAIAAITSRIKIRAGSVVLPLHDPIRVAEEWSVVDNLSGGRVGLSFASGWHANDFALKPDAFADRRKIMSDGIDTVRRLWRGEAVRARSGNGQDIDVRIFPRPVQAEPDVWVTTAGNVDTFRLAGQTGANILTNLLGQTVDEVAEKIAAYRHARRDAGHRGDGQVTLMLHTFVGTDVDDVRRVVRGPFIDYLKTSTELVKKARWEFPAFAAGGRQSGQLDNSDLSEQEIDAMMVHAFDRYFETSGLFGTPDSCAPLIARLKAAGVDEIACLLDFGVDSETVLEHLASLNELRHRHRPSQSTEDYSIAGQIVRHGVTHMQGTPSLFRALAADADGREALSHVGTVLVGGEPLPPALAADLLGPGRKLLNMYGPTETTVWSSVASIEDATQPITIGQPIANTEIYIARPDGRLAPIGATGELLIGGAGVTKGYWKRPDLTAERFIPNPFVPNSTGPLYRTGDLARYREDGTIEFLGRADHQIKLHGHRIELGEIEAVLEAHAAVRQAVVALDRSTGTEGRLVAYVVPADEDAGDAGSAATSEWQRVWEESYRQGHEGDDAAFNTSGWISSYTGQPIPAGEMREWLEHTAARILDLPHRRVLEIGCGTGLVLFKIAPHCEEYVGLDFSSQAVRRVEREARHRGLTHVSVHAGSADTVAELVAGREPFDLVVLNSVAQYFPDTDYLIRVLEQAAAVIRPGGAVFVGDLRNLTWLEAFHASVEIERAPADATREDLQRRIQERVANEPELVLDPAFFRQLLGVIPRFSGATLYLKRGEGRNEMVRFRYDAVLSVDAPGLEAAPRTDVDIAASASLEDVRNALGSCRDDVRLRGIVNGRVALDQHALDLLRAPDAPATVGELRQRLGGNAQIGIDPHDAARLNEANLEAICSERDPWTYDLVSRHSARARAAAPRSGHAPFARTDLSRFSNQPRRARAGLQGLLKQHVRDRLPPYMVPSVFMTLETLPLTSNGKIDRKRLPSPDRTRVDTAAVYVAPASELEQQISRVWQDLLHLERVSVDDNFFDIGANSLLMVRAQMGLAEALNRSVSLVDFFRFPTIRSLARALSDPGGDSPVLVDSALRAHSRREALERRRHGRTLTRQTLKP